LHGALTLGVLTERWIETQLAAQREFDARAIGYDVASGGDRSSRWYVAKDRLLLRFLYGWVLKSGGRGGGTLARLFERNPPIAVHSHFGGVAAAHTRLASSLETPLVAGFYGYDASLNRVIRSPVWRRRYRRLFDEVSAVLVEGPRMAERVGALGCPHEKLRIVRLPADASGLDGISRRQPNEFLVVAAGRFVTKKGFDTAVRAFAKALRGRDARLLMIGGGELQGEYRRLAHDGGVEAQVTWVDGLPFREFMSQLAGASVAVFPSRSAPDGDTEGGAPVTLIETQWLGVPTLVSDHDDLPFVAAPGGSRTLPATEVDAWAEALRELYDNSAVLGEMGVKASAFARANHSPEGNAATREAIYAELAGLNLEPQGSLARA
jgi:colanic acid/amylovoran biosynthesis glycosyltransferase